MQRQPFTKLLIWQKAMDLVDAVYEATEDFPKTELFNLTSQSRRSAVSIPSNIAEGSQRISTKEFAQYILIAKGSLAELYTQIHIAQRRKILAIEKGTKILGLIDELSRMMFAFHKKLFTVH